MILSGYLLYFIAVAISLVGMVFLLFPDQVSKLESLLNATWGEQEIGAVRLGLPREQRLEQVLNRNVLEKRITWDHWAHKHPRRTGVFLCLLAGILWWLTIAAA